MIKKYFTSVIAYPIYIFSLLLNKDSSIWLFSSWNGKSLTDNPRAFFDFCHSLPSSNSKRFIWITKSKSLAKRYDDFEIYYAYSFSGVYYQCRAGVVIYSDSIVENFFEHCITPNVFQVQTWHGIPLKKIRNHVHVRSSKIYSKFLKCIFPFRYDNPSIVLSTSSEITSTLSEAFGVPTENVHSLGYPRNDKLQNCKIDSYIGVYKILYAPTYRDFGTNPIINENNLKLLSNFLVKVNAHLFLKLHPAESKSIKIDILPPNIFVISPEKDLNEVLSNFDMLVSDYSGCIIDFLLLNRPIILFNYDYSEYSRNHGLYSYYKILIEDVDVSTEVPELVNRIEKLIRQPKKYDRSKLFFHNFHDKNASRRLYETICKKI